MGLIQAIINFFKKLFGMSTDEPALSSGAAPASAGAAPAGASAPSPSMDMDDDHDDDDDPAKLAQERWQEMQQLIARCEAEGLDLAGIDVNDPSSFWQKQFAMEQEEQNGVDQETAIRNQGFRDWEHFDLVRDYVMAKWSVLGTNDDGEPEVLQKDEFTNAAMQVRMGQMQGMQQAQLQADPSQLEPINGVSLEQWAGAAAALIGLPQNASEQQAAEVLAQHGLDKATYDSAAAGWQQRMQNDPTGAISTKYAEAFSGAQNAAVGASGGDEPCSFEKFVEIMAAQTAWSEQGRDVNAELQNVFGINAGEYSRYSSYWSPKMGTDMALMRQYTQLEQKYKQKYSGGGMDDDLSI